MDSRPSSYRATLIAAALAIGCFGAAAAQARDHGWRGHDEERGAYRSERGWRDGDHDRGWRDGDHDRGWREHGLRRGARYGYAEPEYLPPVGYYPPPPPLPAYGPGGVSLILRLPL